MQKFKEWLRPFSDFFLNGFSDTFQLLLDNFLGDYLEDPKQLNMTTLIKGVEMLKLNKAFINELLGQSLFRLEEAYIESIKVANLKFEARGLKLVFVMSQEINMEQLKAYIEKTDAAMEKEKQKLAQLNQLREEVYKHTELEQSCDLSKSMRPQTGLIQFLGLVDTLLSNSSLTIKDINIVLKAENGKEYQFHIHQTNVDFQKPDLNNLLFISFGINLIELRLEKEQIAQIQNALKFEMVLETRNGRVSTKLDGKMSSLDLVVNKKQIQSLLQTVQNYLTITDELNKCILQLKEDPGVEFDDDDDQEIGKTEASLIDSLPSQMKPRFQKIIANPQYIDSLNLNLQQSLATHPIPKQQEQQFIEFSQSIFNSCILANCNTNAIKLEFQSFCLIFQAIRN